MMLAGKGEAASLGKLNNSSSYAAEFDISLTTNELPATEKGYFWPTIFSFSHVLPFFPIHLNGVLDASKWKARSKNMASSTQKATVRLFEDAIVSCSERDPVEWPNMTVRRLAAFLSLNQGVRFTRREVSDALWDNERYRSNSLSVALYQMKHALERVGYESGQILKADRSSMEVSDMGVEVDWLIFLDAAGRAEAELSAEAALSAISLVTGPLLFEMPDEWALHAKQHFEERIESCLRLIGHSLPRHRLMEAADDLARIIAYCADPQHCGGQLAEVLAGRDEGAAHRFSAAAQRLGISLGLPDPPNSSNQRIGVLVLVDGAEIGHLAKSNDGAELGISLPSNAAAFLNPDQAMAAAQKVAEAHPTSKVLVSVEVFGASNEIPPGAWAVIKHRKGPGVHVDGSTPLKRPRLFNKRQASGGLY